MYIQIHVCIHINIRASTYFSFAYTYKDTRRDMTQARVQFKMDFFDLASGDQAASQTYRCIKRHNNRLQMPCVLIFFT